MSLAPMPSLPPNPASEPPVPAILESLLQTLAALAATRAPYPNAGFEIWSDDDNVYFQAELTDETLPDIDLSTHDGIVMIRVTRQRSDPDSNDVGRTWDDSFHLPDAW